MTFEDREIHGFEQYGRMTLGDNEIERDLVAHVVMLDLVIDDFYRVSKEIEAVVETRFI